VELRDPLAVELAAHEHVGLLPALELVIEEIMGAGPQVFFQGLGAGLEPPVALSGELGIAHLLGHPFHHAKLGQVEPTHVGNQSVKRHELDPFRVLVAGGHADDLLFAVFGPEVHGVDGGPLHRVIELLDHRVVAGAKPHLVDHLDHGYVAAGDLVRPDRLGELGRRAEHPHDRAVGKLVVLVGAERGEGQLGEEVDHREVAVQAARDALDLRAVARGFDHAEQAVLRPDPLAQRRLGLGPQAGLRNHVEVVHQRVAEPDRELLLRVDDLLPSQDAFQERLVPGGQQPGGLGRAGVVLGVGMGEGIG